MRIVLVAITWVVLVGGLALYMNQRSGAAVVVTHDRAAAAGVYRIQLTPTFGATPDPFALRLDENAASAALVVRLNGEEIYRATDRLGAGAVVEVSPVPGLRVGENELYIEAAPPMDEAGQAHALRVEVFRDEAPLVDETIWSAPGVRLAAPLRVTIADAEEASAHAHE